MEKITNSSIETLNNDFKKAIWKELHSGRPKLLLVSGGSVVPLVIDILRNIPGDDLSYLSIGLVDERFGKPGHPDSNFQQYQDSGIFVTLAHKDVNIIPVLHGLDLEATASDYEQELQTAITPQTQTISVFGLGADGHTAGIFPLEEQLFKTIFNTPRWVVGYQLPTDYPDSHKHRLTITPHFIEQKIDLAFMYAVGNAKIKAIQHFLNRGYAYQTPANILKSKPGFWFTDQVI